VPAQASRPENTTMVIRIGYGFSMAYSVALSEAQAL
jgi:hypothetical protein